MPDPRPILDLIIRHESGGAASAQGVPTAYDVVWSGIAPEDRPVRRLTSMTVAEVLDWQDRIDGRYRSEAAGAYQILEDTLRELVEQDQLEPDAPFDSATQDRAAVALLNRRGWSRLLAGDLGVERFADKLAREWASLPVHQRQLGHGRMVDPGQSYYAGDGLNRAHATPAEVMGAIRAALAAVPRRAPTGDRDDRLAQLERREAAQDRRIAALEARLSAVAEAAAGAARNRA